MDSGVLWGVFCVWFVLVLCPGLCLLCGRVVVSCTRVVLDAGVVHRVTEALPADLQYEKRAGIRAQANTEQRTKPMNVHTTQPHIKQIQNTAIITTTRVKLLVTS